MSDAPPRRLSLHQRLALQGYLRYRQSPPTLGMLMRELVPVYLLLLALGALVVWLGARVGLDWVAPVLCGLGAGVVLRDIGTLRHFLRVWPALGEVLDWTKVETALTQSPAPDPKAELRALVRPKLALKAGLAAGILIVGGVIVGVEALARYYDPVRTNPPGAVVLLATDWCGYCARMREYFAANDIPYTEIDTEKSLRGMLAFEAVDARGVPVTIVGDQVFRGFGKLDGSFPVEAALEAAGYAITHRLGAPAAGPRQENQDHGP